MAFQLFPNRIHFTNLGRNKADLIENVKDEKEFFRIVGRFLMSRDIEYDYDLDKNHGEIVVGGFRMVGNFKVIAKGA